MSDQDIIIYIIFNIMRFLIWGFGFFVLVLVTAYTTIKFRKKVREMAAMRKMAQINKKKREKQKNNAGIIRIMQTEMPIARCPKCGQKYGGWSDDKKCPACNRTLQPLP